MIYLPNIAPQLALRPYVKQFMVLHVRLDNVPAHLRIKPFPPDADQGQVHDQRGLKNATTQYSTSYQLPSVS